MLIISYVLTCYTDPGTIPEDHLWDIQIPENIPDQVKVELYLSYLNKREEVLSSNKNILSDECLNDSRSTTSNKSILINLNYKNFLI